MGPHTTADVFAQRALANYTATAHRAASEVIAAYSTSFFAATRLLGRRNRRHIRNIYALVRVADELVDGVAQAAGLSSEAQLGALNQFETATLTAVRTGYSPDLVIHAFAHTARWAGIDVELVRPFFASMRDDLVFGAAGEGREQARIYDAQAHAEYVYGSAEVVGLMCLRVFFAGVAVGQEHRAAAEFGARQLGAALQNINFLRDVADDSKRLGRHYLGTLDALTATEKDRWVATARGQLADARATFGLLPPDARRAVCAVHDLFAALLERIDGADCATLLHRRVRVPDPLKVRILTGALLAPPIWERPL